MCPSTYYPRNYTIIFKLLKYSFLFSLFFLFSFFTEVFVTSSGQDSSLLWYYEVSPLFTCQQLDSYNLWAFVGTRMLLVPLIRYNAHFNFPRHQQFALVKQGGMMVFCVLPTKGNGLHFEGSKLAKSGDNYEQRCLRVPHRHGANITLVPAPWPDVGVLQISSPLFGEPF